MDKKQLETYVQQQLFSMQDEKYRDFHSRLMPGIDKALVIGVRTPALRKFAGEFGKTPAAQEFLQILPHKYYEENNLHGMLLAGQKDFDACVAGLDRFLPYVDNWATCDLISPKVFHRHLPELLPVIRRWIRSDRTYTVRFGIGMLMSFYLDEAFSPEYPKMVSEVTSEEYYVNMMIAWYFATALAKQYEAVIPYLLEKRLSPWVHNKTIRKARESFRIPPEQKEYLKTLRV